MPFLILLFSLILRSITYDLSPVFSLEKTESVSISASIGENEVTIYGYTSPNSKVELTGINVYSLDYSDATGYFEFNKLVLPKNPPELCLQSKDSSDLSSSLVCVPPPPAINYHTNIGPIILPPTISLSTDNINPNSTVISSGQSIPKSTVTVYFYKVNDSAQSFPKTVKAYSLPQVETTTNENGDYNINLPTAYSSNYRLYTSVKYNDNFSPKSNTLLYSLPSLFWLFLQQHAYLMVLLPVFILSLLLFFFFLFFDSSTTTYHLRPKHYLPAIRTQQFPVIYPDYLPRISRIPN